MKWFTPGLPTDIAGPYRRALILSVLLKMCRVALSYKDARPLVQIADIDLTGSKYTRTVDTVASYKDETINGIQALTHELYDTYRSTSNNSVSREHTNKRPDMAGELLDMIAEISPEYKARVEFRLKADEPDKFGRRFTGERA